MTAGNDANASNAALANAAGALPPWQRLCSLTTRVSRGIDALIDGVLQDNDVVVVVEKPPCFANDKHVLPHTTTFRARNKVVVPYIRRGFALLCVVGMVAWLLVDVLYQDANGLVPGLRDTYVIDSKPFNPNEPQQQDNSTTSVCTCTYSTTSSGYRQPPYTALKLNPSQNASTFHTFLAYCNQIPGRAELLNNATPAGQLLISTLDAYYYQLSLLRVQAPTSAIMLPKEGWKAARMAEAQRALHAGLTAAKYKIWSAPPSVLTDAQVEMGLQYVALLHAGFSKALGRLLDMPDDSTTVEMVSQASDNTTSVSCPNVPIINDLPLVLDEWCVPVSGESGRTADTGDNERSCSDPYTAYVQWCAPALCHTLGPKSHYLQAVQIMSAIGGVYSIIAMFAFATVWRAFCALERQVDIDGLCLRGWDRLKKWWTGCIVKSACCCCRRKGCLASDVDGTLPQLQPQKSMGVPLQASAACQLNSAAKAATAAAANGDADVDAYLDVNSSSSQIV